MTRRLLAAVLIAGVGVTGAHGQRSGAAVAPDPVVSLWYRGQPAGIPRGADLAEIRAQGFRAVTWPLGNATGTAALTTLANAGGLSVMVRAESVPLTADSARVGADTIDVPVATLPVGAIAPLVWRAVAHGARVIAFDPGRTPVASLVDREGRVPAWMTAAADLSRQFRVNGGLLAQCRPGPAVSVDRPVPPAIDIVLLDAQKSWVVVATNASGRRVRATAHLPAVVPYALWLNLLTGNTLAMRYEPAGPTWVLDLEAWGVRVDVIEKTLK